jgi:hypothetical protein
MRATPEFIAALAAVKRLGAEAGDASGNADYAVNNMVNANQDSLPRVMQYLDWTDGQLSSASRRAKEAIAAVRKLQEAQP